MSDVSTSGATFIAFIALILGIGIGMSSKLDERGITSCEAHLPRDHHCVLLAVPENHDSLSVPDGAP